MTNNMIPISEETGSISRIGRTQIPLDASKLFHQGMAWLGHGKPEQALLAFEHALESVPDFADVHIGMGIAYARCSNTYPAIEHLLAAVKLAPQDFYAHYKLSQLYYRLRLSEKGYEEARAALSCATQVTERQFVVQLLQQQSAREGNGFAHFVRSCYFNTSAAVDGALTLTTVFSAAVIHICQTTLNKAHLCTSRV